MEGKEQRFGIADSSLWTAVTTVTSCGAVNAAFESLTGLGGLVPIANLATGEVIFGGVGSGLYSMLLFVLLAVFIAGLMVGRTPEFLGKKIEAREMKLVSLGVLVTPLLVLLAAGLASATELGHDARSTPGHPQGFSETLYAYMSQANNNGSAFAGYTGFIQPNAPGNVGSYGISFADLLGGAGDGLRPLPADPRRPRASPARWPARRSRPAGLGTMRTDYPTFVFLLIGVVDPRRRPHLLPRLPARAGRPGPDHEAVLMMRKDLITALIAIVVHDRLPRPRLPAGDHRHRPGPLPRQGRTARKVEVDGKVVGSSLIGQEFSEPVIGKNGKPKLDEEGEPKCWRPTSAYFQRRPSATGYTRRRHLLQQPRPQQQANCAKSCAKT